MPTLSVRWPPYPVSQSPRQSVIAGSFPERDTMSNYEVMDTSPSPVPEPVSASVEQQLRSSGYASLRKVTVTQFRDQIYLGGKVPSYYLKQLASVIAGAVGSDLVIRNEVVVDGHAKKKFNARSILDPSFS